MSEWQIPSCPNCGERLPEEQQTWVNDDEAPTYRECAIHCPNCGPHIVIIDRFHGASEMVANSRTSAGDDS